MIAPITYSKDDNVFELARQAAEIAATHAAATDRDAAFPDAGVQALRDKGLMGLIVPKDCGGFGASYVTAIEVAQILGGACLSTSMLWSMHCQHVAVIDDYAPEPLRSDVLRRIAAGKLLLASVTTEPSKGGHIMSALSSLTPDGDGQRIDREAPVVTGGLQSDGFLISLRRSPDATPSEVVFVYAERAELELKVTGVWDTVGMRGTVSLPMHISGRVPAGRILEPEGGFPRLSATTLVPAGHILWAASWLGAAKGAYHQLMHILRTPELRQGFPLKSDLFRNASPGSASTSISPKPFCSASTRILRPCVTSTGSSWNPSKTTVSVYASTKSKLPFPSASSRRLTRWFRSVGFVMAIE